jgi:hypothetical protein
MVNATLFLHRNVIAFDAGAIARGSYPNRDRDRLWGETVVVNDTFLRIFVSE